MDEKIGLGLYQSCGERAECWTCVCILVAVVWGGGVGRGAWTKVWRGGVISG